jgi:AraC-like DNA-binding protein
MVALRQMRMKRAADMLAARTFSVEQIARADGYRSCSSFLRAFRQVHGYVPEKSEGDGQNRLKIWRGGHGSRSRQGRCDAIASELRSMINGYRIDSHRVFPFIRRRRHPPTNSQYAFQAACCGTRPQVGRRTPKLEE